MKIFIILKFEHKKNPGAGQTLPINNKKPDFIQRVEARLEYTTYEGTDFQAMSFYAWLKAKMHSRTYDDVLLELESGLDAVTDSLTNNVIIQVF